MPQIAVLGRVGAHQGFLSRGVHQEATVQPDTPFGRSNPIHLLRHRDIDFAVVSRFGEERYATNAPSLPVRAYLWALKDTGVERILSLSAPGAVNEAFRPGDLVVPDDVIDETTSRPRSFFVGTGLGFIRQNPVFCPELRGVLLKNEALCGRGCHPRGVYVCTEGPRLETPAEIRKYRLFGADLVGETLCPEVFLARELELCYAPICYVVNYAEGVREAPHRPGVLFEGLLSEEDRPKVEGVERDFPDILLSVIEDVSRLPRACHCKYLMLRYKLRGDISEDWKTWIR